MPTARFRDRAFLEAALLRELSTTWSELSRDLFKNALRPPVISLTDDLRRLGAWSRSERTLSLSRKLVFEQPWGVVREVLKHEIAHQYVDEFLRIHDQAAHGPAFARVCRERAIDVSATGMPTASVTEQHPMLRRIMRLLALADSPNLHEAEAAMNEARRLMLLHNIDASAAAEKDGFRFRHVGPVKARTEGSERILAGILGQHFFVSVIWVQVYMPFEARMGQVLEICGTPANLDVAEYVHRFLTETAQRLWREHKRARGIRSDRHRRSFAVDVMAGFLEKLDGAERQNRSQSNALVRLADAPARCVHAPALSTNQEAGDRDNGGARGLRAWARGRPKGRGSSAGRGRRGREDAAADARLNLDPSRPVCSDTRVPHYTLSSDQNAVPIASRRWAPMSPAAYWSFQRKHARKPVSGQVARPELLSAI